MTNDDDPDDHEVPVRVADDIDGDRRNRLESEAERALKGIDTGIVDVLAWMLETETRSRIYVFLRKHPHSTSEEVAEGTGLYPSTVREALADMHDEDIVSRAKRESDTAGNNPYEYEAIPPSSLVGDMIGGLQDQLNGVMNLDRRLHGKEPTSDSEPITIHVDDPVEPDDDGEEGDEGREGSGDDDREEED